MKIAAPYPGTRNPIVVCLMSRIQRVSQFYHVAHTSSTQPLQFCHHSFGPFAKLFVNLTMRIRALFPKSGTTLGLAKHILEDAIFHRMNWWKTPL